MGLPIGAFPHMYSGSFQCRLVWRAGGFFDGRITALPSKARFIISVMICAVSQIPIRLYFPLVVFRGFCGPSPTPRRDWGLIVFFICDVSFYPLVFSLSPIVGYKYSCIPSAFARVCIYYDIGILEARWVAFYVNARYPAVGRF